MVRNYRNINDDIRVILKLAKRGLEQVYYRTIKTADDPRPLIAQFESDKEAVVRLEGAIKS